MRELPCTTHGNQFDVGKLGSPGSSAQLLYFLRFLCVKCPVDCLLLTYILIIDRDVMIFSTSSKVFSSKGDKNETTTNVSFLDKRIDMAQARGNSGFSR